MARRPAPFPSTRTDGRLGAPDDQETAMARPRPPRPEPIDPLDRALEEAEAEAERIEKRRLLAVLRRSNADWWARQHARLANRTEPA